MAPGSMMMIHDAFGFAVGDAAEMAKMARTLDQVSGNIAAIYADRCGRTADQWRDAMKAETWYTAGESPPSSPTPRDLTRGRHRPGVGQLGRDQVQDRGWPRGKAGAVGSQAAAARAG
jgi:Clp protease